MPFLRGTVAGLLAMLATSVSAAGFDSAATPAGGSARHAVERLPSPFHATTVSSKRSIQKPLARAERGAAPEGIDLSCPGGRVDRIVDCPEVVCPCQRGKNIVLARAHDPKTGCCNTPSCDRICSERARCPRFSCPCGVPGDLAAATDETSGKCITDQKEVCRRVCRP